jgi:hypothetical protein
MGLRASVDAVEKVSSVVTKYNFMLINFNLNVVAECELFFVRLTSVNFFYGTCFATEF